jgi:predicted helicase
MSKQSINQYYNKLSQYKRFGGTRNEQSIRRAFANLLEEYCLPKNLLLVDEVKLKESSKRPDGTIKDALQLDWGFWESKDPKDDIDEEIKKKFEIGYPNFNIIFENSVDIVLYQQGQEVIRGKMDDADLLDTVLTTFINYERPEIREFHSAIEKFKEDIPEIVEALRSMIAKEAEENKKFQEQRSIFWEVCKESINPEISAFDIREMLIQHILTAEIFDSVFGESHFHRENNIARELEKVVDTFFIGATRRNTLNKVDNYYKTIKREAASIDNIHEKQKFLKIVYENFYKAYNPKGADKLGVVYTPNEIVKFMVESTDYLLEKHFNKSLADKNVQILDPATGTGTFITDIIEYIPPQYLEHKFKNEIHCNELAILPYYIANLNIEYTYQQKMGEYAPFENIVFVDTLDNLGFDYENKQYSMFAMTAENLERIKKQNSNDISVIIGNPPYNANQQNENDNNKNREYKEVDKRIKDTYVKNSKAQKTKAYDMYTRFFRWASDRLSEDGIIAFISNSSILSLHSFDGFRESIKQEFDYAYFVDLGGDIRALSGKDGIFLNESHTIFGTGAMVGIAISFLIKKRDNKNENCDVKYVHPCDIRATRKEKLEYLQDNPLKTIAFEKVRHNAKNNWINQTDNDFEELIPLASKTTKTAKGTNEENAVFKLFCWGNSSNRDNWVYDIDNKNLTNKIKYFIKKYNSFIASNDTSFSDEIKWSRDLKNKFNAKKRIPNFSDDKICNSYFRPFSKHSLYSEKLLNDVLTDNHIQFFGNDFSKKNKVICITNHKQLPFLIHAVDCLVDAGYGSRATHNIALYRYTKEGMQIDNITDWGLKQFTDHYGSISSPTIEETEISKEDIFYYTYGVLHNPNYRKKYEINLKLELPRLPFYDDFRKWVDWGKELMDLHIGYEEVEPWDLQRIESEKPKNTPKPKLKADTDKGEIVLDENTTLSGIPSEAWEYKLGNRSAIHWILDQYKEKKPRDKTIAEKFNTYKFADYKEKVIDLIMRVTRVSVRTVEIMKEMEKMNIT